MKWQGLFKRYGYQFDIAGAEYDPFQTLAAQAQQAGLPVINVNCNVGAAREYGEVKCGFSVTVACPQTEKNIDMAGEMAFRKAVELTNDAASHLGLPQLPAIPEDT